jgi:hypothetical protein
MWTNLTPNTEHTQITFHHEVVDLNANWAKAVNKENSTLTLLPWDQ